MTRTSLQPPRCTARHADVRCDRPAGHGGHHRHEYPDPTNNAARIMSWTDRTALT